MKKHNPGKLKITKIAILCLAPELNAIGPIDIPADLLDPRETYLCPPPYKP
ncbi:hypothetical protein [Taibaiella chishuiensis]|uniref:Uncharacterized protein n=1 Tax=Taibaiella chishuiensis TaxID=1434707 RepID=A0A2P8D0J9_9BACT|nr:hypothetical protein [Taibaiella chishuiensis]PSK90743.1 hypothetical protein B0I18_107153 [Taibaiella chishuiensis]